MTELFLNNQRVIPKHGSSIKFTAQNVFFAKSASYTLDIELPLDIEQNRQVLGWLNRIDTPKVSMQWEARLVVDNVNILVGIATLTSCNELSARVQLLGEASAYNFRNKLDNLFIDELEMGDWREYFDTVHTDPVRGESRYLTVEGLSNTVYGHKYPFVCYPVYNPNADLTLNNILYRLNNGSYYFEFGYYLHDTGHGIRTAYALAVQPYLWAIAEKIATATGYTLARADNYLYNNALYNKIFFVNANEFTRINASLPHWSVNEWWSNLENVFGLVVDISYANKTIKLRSRSDYFIDTAPTLLDSIEEHFQVDIDDDSESDISSTNVGFASHEGSPIDTLSEYVLGNNATDESYADLADLSANCAAPVFNTIYKCADGRWYIYSRHVGGNLGFLEVNMFRPRIAKPNSNDIDVELKFVPARYIDADFQIYSVHGAQGGARTWVVQGTYNGKMLQVPNIDEVYGKESDEAIDIDAIIFGDEEEGDRDKSVGIPDVMHIAIENEANPQGIVPGIDLADGGNTGNAQFILPYPYLRCQASCAVGGSPSVSDSPYSLSLIPIADEINLGSESMAASVVIDTTVKHAIKFVSSEIPSPDSVFLIHNRKFVCEKIEADIDSDGLKPLLTGYFYELH